MAKKLMETKIPQIYNVGLYSEKGFDVAKEHTDKVLTTMVMGVTTCLADIKSKEFPVVFMFREANGEFVAAAMVEYFENEDDSTRPGNWNYSWTFNEEDVPSNARVITPYDNDMESYFRSSAYSRYGMVFEKVEYMAEVYRYLLIVIKNWLDENASESEETCIELDGVIQFRVAVEDGIKIMSAEPDGEVKQLIKDDAAIEV